MKLILILALLILSCGDELEPKVPAPPKEPKQGTERECRVCQDEEGWYNPPISSHCGDGTKSCVRWCGEYNCQRWARQ